MKTIFDEYGNLNIEDLIMNSPSFENIVSDNIITEDEIQSQSDRVIDRIRRFEASATPEQIDYLAEILAEISVLIAIKGMATSNERQFTL